MSKLSEILFFAILDKWVQKTGHVPQEGTKCGISQHKKTFKMCHGKAKNVPLNYGTKRL
jgi:hypothetical protein